MAPAVRAARGSSIIVPTRWSRCTECSWRARWAASSISARMLRSSSTAPTSGTMISGWAWPPRSMTMAAASRIAWDCISNRPGMAMPRRTPRRPSIGFSSCSRCTASSSSESVSCSWPIASATATFTDSSVKSGRNSCSGGSSRRTVTGRPSIASKISMKSARCSGSSSSKTTWRSSAPSARISRSTSSRRAPRNMCSVRHRPMPSAPNRRARAASGALSALARTCIRRCLSAALISRSTAATTGPPSSTRHGALEVAHDGGGAHRRPRRGRPRRSSRRWTGCRPRARRCRRGW